MRTCRSPGRQRVGQLWQARGVRGQLDQSDVGTPSRFGQVRADLVIDGHFAGLDHLCQEQCGERLCNRPDVEEADAG